MSKANRHAVLRCFARLSLLAWCCFAFAQPTEKHLALVIGNDRYRYVAPLKTAANDARAVQSLLHERYGFETNLLIDATRAQIMSALSAYRRINGADWSLLIYYAGHGYADPAGDKSYWWPVNARPEDLSEWISADDITTSLKAIEARHVLVVSDSCFAGTLSRGVNIPAGAIPASDRSQTLRKLQVRRSRELLASGGNEPVADGGPGGHSIFAGAFLRALETMEPAEFSVEEVFRDVRESVGGGSSQLPQLDPLRNSGHDGGSFVFTRNATAANLPAPARLPAPVLAPVQLSVTVIDQTGKFIPNLPRANFRVLDRGVAQPLVAFAGSAGAAATVALLVEFSRSSDYRLNAAGATKLLDTLNAADYLAAAAFDFKLQILSDFTTNRTTLHLALSRLQVPSSLESNLYDAVVEMAIRMQPIQGRKAIVLFASGLDTFSKLTLQAAREKIRATGVPIFAISPPPAGLDPVRRTAAQANLRDLSTVSGGQAFFAQTAEQLPALYPSILNALHDGDGGSGYMLSFQPTDHSGPRDITVELVTQTNAPLQILDEKGAPQQYRILIQQLPSSK